MDKNALIQAEVTLNGKPAKIIGKLCAFARVVSLDGLLDGEWSWEAAERIVKKGGRFTLPNHAEDKEHWSGKSFDAKKTAQKVTLDDVMREFERLNFVHVNDSKEPMGQLTEVYSCAVVEMAKRLKELDPSWSPPLKSEEE